MSVSFSSWAGWGSLPCEASGQETSFIHANSPHHHTLLHSTQFQCIVSQHYIALPIIEKYECTQNSEMHIVYWTMHSSYTVKHLQKACCSRILDNVHWWTILGTFWGGTSQWCPLQLSHAFCHGLCMAEQGLTSHIWLTCNDLKVFTLSAVFNLSCNWLPMCVRLCE